MDTLDGGEEGEIIKFSPFSHQVCIKCDPYTNDEKLFNYCWNNSRFMGCYFLKNPNNKSMTCEEFGNILYRIGQECGHTKKGIKVTGQTYASLLLEIEAVMCEIITKLNTFTPVGGWKYYEDRYTKECNNLENKLRILDNL